MIYKGNFSRYDQYTKHNLIFIIFDEISLEGLDGITIEALWKRIEHTLMAENMLDGLKEVIWQIVRLNEQISFFQLPDARPELVIYNKDTDVSQRGPDIYKVSIYIHILNLQITILFLFILGCTSCQKFCTVGLLRSY